MRIIKTTLTIIVSALLGAAVTYLAGEIDKDVEASHAREASITLETRAAANAWEACEGYMLRGGYEIAKAQKVDKPSADYIDSVVREVSPALVAATDSDLRKAVAFAKALKAYKAMKEAEEAAEAWATAKASEFISK